MSVTSGSSVKFGANVLVDIVGGIDVSAGKLVPLKMTTIDDIVAALNKRGLVRHNKQVQPFSAQILADKLAQELNGAKNVPAKLAYLTHVKNAIVGLPSATKSAGTSKRIDWDKVAIAE